MDKSNHLFLFQAGQWLGDGKIALPGCAMAIPFYMRWKIFPEVSGTIEIIEEIKLQGAEEKGISQFSISQITPEGFKIKFKNNYLESSYSGTGLYNEKRITWEYQHQAGGAILGLDAFTCIESELYQYYGAYRHSPDSSSTLEGRFWKRTER